MSHNNNEEPLVTRRRHVYLWITHHAHDKLLLRNCLTHFSFNDGTPLHLNGQT